MDLYSRHIIIDNTNRMIVCIDDSDVGAELNDIQPFNMKSGNILT